VAGLLACALANPAEVIVALAALLLGWAYSAGPALKRGALSLTCVAATAAGLSYVAGAAATGAISARSLAVPLCVALWVGLCAASKDFSDVEGDRIAGRRTLPIVLGNVVAARVVAVLSVAGGALTIGIAMWTGLNFAPAAAVAIGSVPLALTALRLASNPDCRVRRRTYRVLMSTQYVANAMLLVTVP
jgi:4-hydroxybenzoate polyprenyltransferase